MTFYILLNQITSIFLGFNLLTTLSFDSEIQSYLYGGSKQDVFIQVTNNHKTLVLKPMRDDGLSNLLVITSKRKYYFQLGIDRQKPHQFIEIKDGSPGHALKKKIESEEFEILEGGSSVLFRNKHEKPVMVNGIEVKDKEYFSKGVPLLLEGRRILN